MNLWKIAWRYLWMRPLVTGLTLLGIALGCMLISSVLTLRRETERSLKAEAGYFDLVVGAKGSPLNLVLSSIYHLGIPNGNIPVADYLALTTDTRVKAAVPIGLGDNYRGFRIVGTTPAMFDLKHVDSLKRTTINLFHLAEGKLFAKDEDFHVVVGATVAKQAHMKLGDVFVGTHGLVALAGSQEHKEFPYKVIGILAPSGDSSDRAIYTTINSVYVIHDRENEIHGRAHNPREVTSVLVQLKIVGLRLGMWQEINKKTDAMAAIPVEEMNNLYQIVLAPIQNALLGMAALVVLVAALTILTTLYQSAERRRREVAVMRALGAHPREIFFLIMLEALTLTLAGIALGWLMGHGGIAVAGIFIHQNMGLSIAPWTADRLEAIAAGVVALVGLLAGLAPAWMTYRRSPVSDMGAT